MRRVLLVEDEILISMVMATSLEDEGYNVLVAADGQQGLEIALKERPEFVITDYMMPRMNGLEMIVKLREQGLEMPIVLATAVSERNLPARDGYDALLIKPYTERQLLELLKKVTR